MDLRITALIIVITSLIIIQGYITYTNLNEYYLINGGRFLSEFRPTPVSVKSILQSKERHMDTLNALDPYAPMFYYNKDIFHPSPSMQQIQKTHSMWWNYQHWINKTFTRCEEKYLGWKTTWTGDLSFNDSNAMRILCHNNDYQHDIRHAHIECYDTKWHKSAYICSFKNIYAYIDDNSLLKFKAFCKQPVNTDAQTLLNNIKASYARKGGNNRYPLYIDIVDDSKSNNSTFIKDSKYFYKDNIWFYDNDFQCESHKDNDKEHIGNPWHCLAHLEYWYRISKAKHLGIGKDNLTLVMSQYNDYKFGPDVPNYHLYSPFFSNIINKDTINRTIATGGSGNRNTLYYIKELYTDERSAKGWGGSIIWAPGPQKSFFQDEECKAMQAPRRSHVLQDLRRDMMNYYELNYLYSSYDWIHELKGIDGINQWDVHGDLHSVANRTVPLIVIATRYVNGRCRYRCLRNMAEIKNVLVKSLGHKFVIVYGNPGTLTFRAQYHLFKNTRIFIGVHGAVFAMAALFMPPSNLKFEICLAGGQPGFANSEIVVRSFGGEQVMYGQYVCRRCNVKATQKPSNVSVDEVIAVFQKSVRTFYNMSMVV